MEPQVWGKHGWFFLHSITMGYPEHPTNTDRDKYRKFFYNVGSVLPCGKCQMNFRKHMEQKSITPALLNRTSLVEWLIDIHNLTNKDTGKKELSYDDVIKIYSNAYEHNQNTYFNYMCESNSSHIPHNKHRNKHHNIYHNIYWKITTGILLLIIIILNL